MGQAGLLPSPPQPAIPHPIPPHPTRPPSLLLHHLNIIQAFKPHKREVKHGYSITPDAHFITQEIMFQRNRYKSSTRKCNEAHNKILVSHPPPPPPPQSPTPPSSQSFSSVHHCSHQGSTHPSPHPLPPPPGGGVPRAKGGRR